MCRIALLIVLAAGVFVTSDAKHVRAAGVRLGPNPGFVFRLRKPALDGLFGGIKQLAGKHAPKVPIPDVEATVSGVDIKTKEVRIKKLAEPEIKYTLAAPNKISGSINFPLINVEGPFEAARRTLIKTQRDNGLVCFTAKNISVAFSGIIGEHDNGQPKFDNFSCSAVLGPASLNIKNFKENFAVDVFNLAAKAIRPTYNAAVCPTIENLVKNHLNRFLGKIPNVFELNKELALKYQVKPRVCGEHVELAFHAKVLTEDVSPFSPAKFNEAPCDDAFFVLLISDAPFNDLAYQAYVNGKLGFTIDKNSHPLIYSLIKLSCKENEACLGNLTSSLAEKYGEDADVEVSFKAIKAPQIEFKQNKATFTTALAAELNITPKNGSGTFHDATATVDVSGSFQALIKDKVLYARATVDEVAVHIDDEHSKKWEEKIRDHVKKIVEESINSGFLKKGLPLNLPFGIGVTEPLIRFSPNTLQIQTGFEYKPQTSSEESEGH